MPAGDDGGVRAVRERGGVDLAQVHAGHTHRRGRHGSDAIVHDLNAVLRMMAAARRALYLALVSAVARAPAFVIPILLAAIFGSGQRTDAYFIAYSAVLFLGGTLGQGVEQAIVPFAARQLHRADGSAGRYLDAAARRSAAAGLVTWLVGLPILVGLAAPALRRLILQYALCFTPLALAWCAAAVFSGALVSQGRIARASRSTRDFGSRAADTCMM